LFHLVVMWGNCATYPCKCCWLFHLVVMVVMWGNCATYPCMCCWLFHLVVMVVMLGNCVLGSPQNLGRVGF
jgi:hypothetical protein